MSKCYYYFYYILNLLLFNIWINTFSGDTVLRVISKSVVFITTITSSINFDIAIYELLFGEIQVKGSFIDCIECYKLKNNRISPKWSTFTLVSNGCGCSWIVTPVKWVCVRCWSWENWKCSNDWWLIVLCQIHINKF